VGLARSADHDGNGLQARLVHHRKRDADGVGQTIIFAVLAASRRVDYQTSWSIRNLRRRLPR
jgi:hypothetical protein